MRVSRCAELRCPRQSGSTVKFLRNFHLEGRISRQTLSREKQFKKDEYHNFLLKANPIPIISIEEFKAHSNQEESTNLLEILSKPGDKDPCALLSMEQMKNKRAEAVSELEEREQLVLSLYS